jgi:hypothetical protein
MFGEIGILGERFDIKYLVEDERKIAAVHQSV